MKKKLEMKFYNDSLSFSGFKDLIPLMDDSTVEITIETPHGWKCERKGCKTDFRHSHGTYPSLSKKSGNVKKNG
jgi:hypothetical protein